MSRNFCMYEICGVGDSQTCLGAWRLSRPLDCLGESCPKDLIRCAFCQGTTPHTKTHKYVKSLQDTKRPTTGSFEYLFCSTFPLINLHSTEKFQSFLQLHICLVCSIHRSLFMSQFFFISLFFIPSQARKLLSEL